MQTLKISSCMTHTALSAVTADDGGDDVSR